MSTLHRMTRSARRTYQRLFERQENHATREVIHTLRQVPALREVARAVLRELADAVHVRVYRPDEYLYYEGDPGVGGYVIQRGRVRLLAEDEAGTVRELRQAGEHEVVGGLSLLGDFRRMETAQAVTEVRVLGFFRPDLRTLTKRNPKAGAAITVALARRLAAQQVALLRLVAERDGKIAALHMLETAVLRADAPRPDVPAVPER